MKINTSPWIHELDHTREPVSLSADIDTDVVVVGAGIAGVSTAFFLLKYTNKRIVLCDKGKLAHGATGHNAGQVVARFERPLKELVAEFGFEQVKKALHDLNSGWNLFEEIFTDTQLNIFFVKMTGAYGFSTLHQVISALQDVEIEIRAGMPRSDFLVSEEAPFLDQIPSGLKFLYKVVPHAHVLEKLETKDTEFHAVVTGQRACMNSALFCQELVKYFFMKYGNRFSLYENTHIHKVVLRENHALLDADKHTIGAERVVLCTNGFEHFEIFNEGGLAIDKKFHHLVEGKVGYMSGYLEEVTKKPTTAIAYFMDDFDPTKDDPYFYLTRRPHEYDEKKHNLVCVGGPELAIRDREEYLNDYDYPEQMPREIRDFIHKVHNDDPKIEYQFTWHGLMGYTPNRVRLIGTEPKNNVLLYNLGCNGLGLIPSVVGGRRISRIIAGEHLSPSIFDPRG